VFHHALVELQLASGAIGGITPDASAGITDLSNWRKSQNAQHSINKMILGDNPKHDLVLQTLDSKL